MSDPGDPAALRAAANGRRDGLPATSSEERLRVALAAARMGTYEWIAASERIIWSDETARLHGIDPREFRGSLEHARALTHPDDLDRVAARMADAFAHGKDFEVEYRAVHPGDQSIHWLSAYGRALRDPGGVIVRIIGAVRDIDREKRGEVELRASVDTARTLNELGQLIAAELDLEKLVQSVTDASTRLVRAQFGAFFYNLINEKGESYTLYTLSGVPREAFSKFPMPRNTDVFRPTFEGTGVVRSDDITRDPRYGHSAPHYGMPRGHLPVVSYLAVPVVSRSGEVLGGLFFGHPQPGNFTARDEELVKGLAAHAAVAIDNARLFQRAQEAVQLRDEFLSIASHELKTPLTPLHVQIQQLRRHVEKGTLAEVEPDRLRQLIMGAERQMLRLTSLVEHLLDVARINTGKFRLERERVDLVALVKEALDRYAPQLAEAGCAVEVHAPPAIQGSWDALRVEQCFINIVTNAAKYAPGKAISVTLSEEGGMAIVEVKDGGPGIQQDDLKRIFKRYERVGTETRVAGLGLGLFISRQIVEAHGGSIVAESAPGQGATFTIRLPSA
ncbi:MAG TPA: ATP-binding protein [Myxococcales bacterium]|nr:ATP-binding protein [Myxococcales bacterium]